MKKMKKYLAIFAVLFTVILSSCSNDDIPVSQSTTFRINPASVVQTFTYEINPGDLEGISSGDELRVRLLIYNSEGVLTKSETQFLSSYASLMTSTIDLGIGDYTAVVVTDVVERSGDEISFACWELSDENSISTAKITDLGYIGGKSKILGLGSTEFSVSGSSRDITINPMPVGAVFCVMFRNIHQYSDIESLTLETNRSSDYLILNNDGGYDIAVQNNNNKYDWRTAYINPSDYPNSTNIYGYYFVFPINNNSFRFRIDIDGSDPMYTDAMPFNITAGSEYYFELDLCDPDFDNGISYGGLEVVSGNGRSNSEQEKLFDEANATYANNRSFYISNIVK